MRKLLFIFITISYLSFGQNVIIDEKDAVKNHKKAIDDFLNLDYKSSLKFSQKVLEYSLQKNNNDLAAKSYNLIGLIYEEFSDTDKAVNFYNKAIVNAKLAKNDTVLGWVYNNLGSLNTFKLNNYKKSLYYYKIAYQISKRTEDDIELLYTRLNIVLSLNNLKRFKESFNILEKLKFKVDKSNEIEAKISFYSLLAEYYFKYENNFEKAEKCYLKSINFANQNKVKLVDLNIVNLYKEVYSFYKHYNKIDKALIYLEKHDYIEDKVFQFEKNENLNDDYNLIALNEVNKKIEKIESENLTYEAKLKNTKFFITGLVVIILLIISFLYFTYKNVVKNKKINSRLKKTNIKLKQAKKNAEHISKLKNQFVSNVSHELRTPLYGVIGMTEILEDEVPNLNQNQHFQSLKFSSKYLLALINDILNVYKIEEGQIQLSYEQIDIRNELKEVIISLESISKQQNNKLELYIDETIPICIKTDKTRLLQIIINLLTNSIKFTKNGNVELRLNFLNNLIEFEVNDTGVGIPNEFIDKVFDKFIQVDRKNISQTYEGTGLGLTIVKKTVELFGGTIKIESNENVGTKVVFNLPYIPCEQIEFENVNLPTVVDFDFSKIKVLIVEDNKVNQIVTSKILEKNQISFEIVDNGFDALDKIKNSNFDLVFMDIHMKGIDGYETSKEIRKFNSTIKIIALTASDKVDIVHHLNEAKMNDVLIKPFEHQDLLKIIKKNLS